MTAFELRRKAQRLLDAACSTGDSVIAELLRAVAYEFLDEAAAEAAAEARRRRHDAA